MEAMTRTYSATVPAASAPDGEILIHPVPCASLVRIPARFGAANVEICLKRDQRDDSAWVALGLVEDTKITLRTGQGTYVRTDVDLVIGAIVEPLIDPSVPGFEEVRV